MSGYFIGCVGCMETSGTLDADNTDPVQRNTILVPDFDARQAWVSAHKEAFNHDPGVDIEIMIVNLPE